MASNPLTAGNITNGAARPSGNVESFPSNKPMSPAQLLEIQELVRAVVTKMGKALQAPTTDKNNQSKFADILMQNMPTITHIARTTPYSSEQIVKELFTWIEKKRFALGNENARVRASQEQERVIQAGGGGVRKVTLLSNPGAHYPLSASLPPQDPVEPGKMPVAPNRPTLTGGIVGGRLTGTPANFSHDEFTLLTLDDGRSRQKHAPGDHGMRRSIQDLVASVDPNVKIEPDVEDLLLMIADEFIDSVANFSCRLAKHRGADTLDVSDLQLHLERNHNIRIPGFASDDTRLALSQASIAPVMGASTKKTPANATTGAAVPLRTHRLNQVQSAKRDGRLV